MGFRVSRLAQSHIEYRLLLLTPQSPAAVTQ